MLKVNQIYENKVTGIKFKVIKVTPKGNFAVLENIKEKYQFRNNRESILNDLKLTKTQERY